MVAPREEDGATTGGPREDGKGTMGEDTGKRFNKGFMFNFNIRKSLLAPALFGKEYFAFSRLLGKIFFGLFLLLLLALPYHFFFRPFPEKIIAKILGALLLSFVFFVALALQEFFYQNRLKKPKPKVPLSKVILAPEDYNLANYLCFKAARSVWQAQKWAKKRKLLPLTSTQLFHFLLKNKKTSFIFLRAGLNIKEVKKNLLLFLKDASLKPHLDLADPLYSQGLQQVLLAALKGAAKKGKALVGVGDLISALAGIDPYFKELLLRAELKAKDIANLAGFQDRVKEKEEQKKGFWKAERLALIAPIGREFAAGYTVTLDQYSHNWTNRALREIKDEIIGHRPEIEELERILSRSALNNVLVVGRPGSGRAQLVKYFAKRSYMGKASSPLLNYKRVIALNLPSLIAQIETIEKAEEVLDRIFKEVRTAGNVILVIEDFHSYVEPKPRPGVLNISGILASYLERVEFQVIALTTYVGLHKYIEQNPSLLKYFSKVEVKELPEEETLRVLEDWVPYFEGRYKKLITYPCLKEVVSLAARYLPDTAFPQKAIDLLDEVMVAASKRPEHPLVLPEDVDRVVTEKTEIPVGKIEEKEKETLLNLEALIHRRIVNQEEAVSDLSEALRRARTEITIRQGPMGTFLFLGPTGVGKTETSKALAEIYFGSEKRMIRLDMSEFQQVADIARLIGSAGQEGLLTTKVREDPFSLLLLDEIEKAHPNILNLFLQVLDEGFLTDGLGRKVNFRNAIIIGTSNAGSDLIWKTRDISKDELMLHLIEKKIFRPEFLNRFDGIILFNPLSRSNLLDIADLMLEKVKENLRNREIILLISPPVKEKIVDLSYSPTFGAREMKRVIQDKIENILAVALLQERIKRGDKVGVEIGPEGEFNLIVNSAPYKTAKTL